MVEITEAYTIACRHFEKGGHWKAEEVCREILKVMPGHVDARRMLADACFAQRKYDEAATAYLYLLKLHPNDAGLHIELGCIRHLQGRLDDALESFQTALTLHPGSFEATANVGLALYGLGRVKESADVLDRAARIRGDVAEIHEAKGLAFMDLEEFDAAVDCFNAALSLNAESTRALRGLGDTYARQGRCRDAARSFHRVSKYHPNPHLWDLRIKCLCPAGFESRDGIAEYRGNLLEGLKAISPNEIQSSASEVVEVGITPPFQLPFHGLDDLPIKTAFANIFQTCFEPDQPQPTSGKPRVGFVVTRGHESVFLRCFAGILNRLSGQSFDAVVICRQSGRQLVSSAVVSDHVGVLVVPDSFDDAVKTIREAQLDLLYHWEIGTDATNYFLPFAHLATVQCTGWGVPATSGIPQVEFYFTNDFVEPNNAEHHYSEQIMSASTMLTFHDRVSAPAQPKTREEFGLRASDRVYMCAQQLCKFHPDFDEVLCNILERDQRGIIVILVERCYEMVLNDLKARMQFNLGEVFSRIRFLPWMPYQEYLGLLQMCDVVLDPLHYGSGLTAYEAFAFGKPIVTRPGEFRRGRYVLGCYRMMGLSECIATSAADYADIAVTLGTEEDHRRKISSEIASRNEILFENESSVIEFERLATEIVDSRR